MDYLTKEFQAFQAFAERFSAVATERLDRFDGGTYFSRLYQNNNAAGDEQRQIGILLEELQLAMESQLLLTPPEGTVLHTAMAEGGVGSALGHLCIALEKCLFFGAQGSMPDFWWVLGWNGGENDGQVGSPSEEGGVSGAGGKAGAEPLSATVHRLTRVQTGHARCRAWARGLLGLDGATPMRMPETNAHDHDYRSIAPPVSPRSSALLPLWLRARPQGASVLDDLCRLLGDFSRRLEERGLSVRPSLDHAWLEQESIAAATTYSWPSFRRARLRCSVRGAGLSAANGDHAGLSLVGPNGCRICCQVGATAAEEGARVHSLSGSTGDAVGEPAEETARLRSVGHAAVVKQENGAATQAKSLPRARATAAPVPVARLWRLLVPADPPCSGGTRIAYYCLGDGPLPPSRGWRPAEAAEAPAPRGGGREDRAQIAGERHGGAEDGLFRAAVPLMPPVGENGDDGAGAVAAGDAFASAGVRGMGPDAVASELRVEAGPLLGDGLAGGPDAAGGGGGRGRPTQRRKRPRPPELTGSGCLAQDKRLEDAGGGEPNDRCEEGPAGGGFGGNAASGVSSASVDDARGDDHDGSDDAVAAFKAERWRLPEPSGELLSRVERARERLERTMEERAKMLEIRRGQLQDDIAAAEQEFREVGGQGTATLSGGLLRQLS
ncbi:unnamed protein product [Scytosiphon promiscuus]